MRGFPLTTILLTAFDRNDVGTVLRVATVTAAIELMGQDTTALTSSFYAVNYWSSEYARQRRNGDR